MLFEAASQLLVMTANIAFSLLLSLNVVQAHTQHFMRTLSKRTGFYALRAEPKQNWSEKYFGGHSGTIICLREVSGKQWGELFQANQNILSKKKKILHSTSVCHI